MLPDFNNALASLGGMEGGYANDPHDTGGETFGGIARRFNPLWPGWPVIDGAKVYADFPATLSRDALRRTLTAMVRDFYQKTYWDALRLSDFPEHSVAMELFEQAINLGIPRAVTNFQAVSNALNDGGERWSDITVDGQPGSQTVATAHAAHHAQMDYDVLVCLNCLQGCHYIASKQERYIRGWIRNRVKL